MQRLVELPMQDGGLVLVQVEDVAGPVTRGFRDHTVSERAQQSFEEALGRVQPATRARISRLLDLADPPDEVEVEFGLGLSAEAGAFIASAGTTANFKVSLLWRRPPPQPGG